MMRSLWTAASGMNGQQFNIDTIANNLSNVNTTGFKKNRPDFEDLLYHTVRMAGTPATEETLVPVGHEEEWAIMKPGMAGWRMNYYRGQIGWDSMHQPSLQLSLVQYGDILG